MDPAAIRHLEEIADRAWPARRIARGDDWEARFSDGMHRRLNSATVWGTGDLDTTVTHLEEWFGARGQSAIFKLTDASVRGLDACLAERGYVPDARVAIMTADLGGPVPSAGTSGVETTRRSEEWADAFAAMSGYGPDRRRLLADVLARIELPAAYASVRTDGEIVAVGMAVAEGRHAGLFEMVTHPEHRNRGHAGAVLGSLLGWMDGQGARVAYLQVLKGNRSAERLYRRTGFQPRYEYWYRVRPDRLSTAPR